MRQVLKREARAEVEESWNASFGLHVLSLKKA